MTKQQSPRTAEKRSAPEPSKAVPCRQGKTPDESHRNFAALATSPELAAYRVIKVVELGTGIGEQSDVPALLEELRRQGEAVRNGDLGQAEAMLMAQAVALQSLFARLIERGLTTQYMPQMEAYLRFGLKAQSQCRATLETLAAVKNPPTVIAQQANIAAVQQVNNEAPRERERPIEQNQLLEAEDEQQRLDVRAARAGSGTDSQLAALGEVHRPEDAGG